VNELGDSVSIRIASVCMLTVSEHTQTA